MTETINEKKNVGTKNIVYLLSAVTKYLHTLYQYHQFCTVRAKKYILKIYWIILKGNQIMSLK